MITKFNVLSAKHVTEDDFEALWIKKVSKRDPR